MIDLKELPGPPHAALALVAERERGTIADHIGRNARIVQLMADHAA